MADKIKKKPTLDQFLAPSTEMTSSWADAEDDHNDNTLFNDHEYAPEPEPVHEEPEPEREVPEFTLPSNPPFQAYVGNLSFQCQEDDLYQFFQQCQINSVRMITENSTGRFKGFCYIEFSDQQSLRNALEMGGKQLMNRTVRVDVAEPRSQGRGPNHRRGNRDGGFHGHGRGDNSWGAPRGQGGRDDREQRGGGGYGQFGRGGGDREHRSGDVREHQRGDRRPQPRASFNEHKPARSPRNEHATHGGQEEAAAPVERKRLALLPRGSKPALSTSEAPATKSSNPFGAARPREEVLANRVADVHLSEHKEKVASPSSGADHPRKENRNDRADRDSKRRSKKAENGHGHGHEDRDKESGFGGGGRGGRRHGRGGQGRRGGAGSGSGDKTAMSRGARKDKDGGDKQDKQAPARQGGDRERSDESGAGTGSSSRRASAKTKSVAKESSPERVVQANRFVALFDDQE